MCYINLDRISHTISIVLPVFNCEQYLERCIQSIQNQTYTDWELCIIDDGSVDNSLEICDHYRNIDRRINVIRQSNHGLSFSRNVGVQESNGDLVLFIDSDDFLSPIALELLYSIQKSKNADIVVGNYCRVPNELDSQISDQMFRANYLNSMEAISNLFQSAHNRFQFGTAWGKIIKRKMLLDNPFPVGKFWEDVPVLYKLYHVANTICSTDSILYCYFPNPKGITASPFSIRNLDYIDFASERLDFIYKHYHNIFHQASKATFDIFNDLYYKAMNSIDSKELKVMIQEKFLILYSQGLFNSLNNTDVQKFLINPDKFVLEHMNT